MCQSLLSCLSFATIVFGLIIVAVSTAVVSSTGTTAAFIHCLSGINITLFISIVLFCMPYLAEGHINTETVLGTGILRLLRSVLILSVVMTITSTTLRIVTSGASAIPEASSYMWLVAGIIFAAIIYVFSLLLSRKHKQMLQER